MKNQIIKCYVPFFEDFITENFIYENEVYLFNNLVFKKLKYENKIGDFLESLREYYYKNKHYYLNRNPITFNQFNTLLRQLCKNNDFELESKVKYNSSKYDVEYYIKL